MAGMSTDMHRKTADDKLSGQSKRLEGEEIEMLKSSDWQLVDVKSHVAQNKTVSADGAFWCFFEIYEDMEENRKQRRTENKIFGKFDADTEQKLYNKGNTDIAWLNKYQYSQKLSRCVVNWLTVRRILYFFSNRQQIMRLLCTFFNENWSSYRDFWSQYCQTTDIGNQTSLPPSTTAGSN